MRKYPLNHLFIKNLLFLVCILIVISGCDKELEEIDENKVLRKLSAQEQELINSTNNLSLDILKAEYQISKNENFLFSPVSVGMALGMIYNGVGEKEKMQIQHIMGLESLVEKEINKSYNELLSFLQVSNNHLDISYANSLWFSNDIDINEEFRTRVMAYYDAEITELNLSKSSSFDLINSWGNLKTNGDFEILLNQTPSVSNEIFLVNAFSLNTNWKHNNNLSYSLKPFYNALGEKQEVNTLNWKGLNVRLNKNDDYSFVEIPFENDQFMLSVIEPGQHGALSDFVKSFTSDDLFEMRENSYEFKANLSLPEINFNDDKQLKSTLSLIGLNDLFLRSTDLSPSFVDREKRISEINHLAKINFSSDVRSLEDSNTKFNADLESIHIDRPFIYFVKDKHTKSVLFAGFYVNPE